MDPLVGKRLSHYEIIQKIGSGGMGVVYRAHDVRLERGVAIKVLPAGVLADEISRRRFRREVLLLSQLSHPNIATVFDFDTQGDWIFLVMEYIAGETLGDRLEKGRLPLRKAVAIVAQFAEALQAAHEQGVIHRDLKPSNVMLTERDLVKVLDFGLARRVEAISGEPEERSAAQPTTLAVGLTDPGQVMGTPGYMSPEQVLAQEQDARTDIFAFGCVLYECLSGRRAFTGNAVKEILNSVLLRDPDWAALPQGVPRTLRELLRRCLEKDPGQRIGSMGEVRAALGAKLKSRRRARPAGSRPVGFPSSPLSFVGRERDIVECRRVLQRAGLLTLTGPGGVGKTSLALKLAEGFRGRNRSAVWMVELAPLTDPSRVVDVVAAALGVRERRGKTLVATIVEELHDQRGLIILDNCEHLLEAASEIVRALLEASPKLRVLATSREALGNPGERVYEVQPLSHPGRGGKQTADSIAPYESVRLFVERARHVRSDFRITDASAAAVAEICRQLDGLPLAIELAAARMKLLSPEEVRSKLGDRFRLLVPDSRLALSRHATLEETIQWSYDMLSEDEQHLVRELGAFIGGWTLESATFVCDFAGDEFAVLDLLNRLVDKSLVVVDRMEGQPTRYRFLETVRQFASDKLKASRENIAVRRRHLGYFLSVAEEAEGGLVGAEQAEWLMRLERDHENVVGAIRWSLEEGHGEDEPVRMAGALWRFWYSHGYFGLGRSLLSAALDRGVQGSATAARTRALRGAGILAFYQGEYEAARTLLEESLAVSRVLGDRVEEARALNALGGISLERGDYPSASEQYSQCAGISREIGDRGGVAVALGNMGTIAKYQGDDQAAEALYEDCLALLREIGDRGNTANVLFDLGAIATRAGETDQARDRLLECARLVQTLGEKRTGAYALEGAGDLLTRLGRVGHAVRLYGAAATLRASIQAPLTPYEESERKARVDETRGALGPSAFDLEWNAGENLSFETAIGCMLQWLSDRPTSVGDETAPHTPIAQTPSESTAHLLARVRQGDAAASDLLVKRYLPALRRWAHGRLPAGPRDLVDTDDVVQVTLVHALRKVQSFEPRREGAFLAYLRKILLNQIRDEIRRATRGPRRESLTEDLLDQAPSPLEATIARGTYKSYESALAKLPARQREAVILRAELGFSYAEVAEGVGCASDDAARMLVTRGLDRVARLMRAKS